MTETVKGMRERKSKSRQNGWEDLTWGDIGTDNQTERQGVGGRWAPLGDSPSRTQTQLLNSA